MGVKFSWVPPTTNPSDSDVGSVLIYRSEDSAADSLGSRSIIDTVGAKDGSGSWVVSYNDTNGTADNLYRIQFWDGTGSSQLSDAIGQEYSELLASHSEVIQLARITNNGEVGSQEVYTAIDEATDEIWFNYGDPIRKTVIQIDSQRGVSGRAYDFTGDRTPIYQIRNVIIADGNDTIIADSNDYEVNFGDGTIKFTDDFLGSYSGDYIYFHWVPRIYNMYVKYLAAQTLLEGELVLTGIEVDNPQVERLKNKINDIKDYMRPKGVYSTKSFEDNVGGATGYEYVPQAIKRQHLFFND